MALRDLDRSMATIQEKSQRILKARNNINVNSISLDYIANLGLFNGFKSKIEPYTEKSQKLTCNTLGLIKYFKKFYWALSWLYLWGRLRIGLK